MQQLDWQMIYVRFRYLKVIKARVLIREQLSRIFISLITKCNIKSFYFTLVRHSSNICMSQNHLSLRKRYNINF